MVSEAAEVQVRDDPHQPAITDPLMMLLETVSDIVSPTLAYWASSSALRCTAASLGAPPPTLRVARHLAKLQADMQASNQAGKQTGKQIIRQARQGGKQHHLATESKI